MPRLPLSRFPWSSVTWGTCRTRRIHAYPRVYFSSSAHRTQLPSWIFAVKQYQYEFLDSTSSWDVSHTYTNNPLINYLIPPAVFVGLVISLWVYKCCMMVIFQNKIIYMPSVPPFSRRAKLSDVASLCKPIEWRQEIIRSLDGTNIALCIGSNVPKHHERRTSASTHLLVLYFQGNASSLPPRLPALSRVLNGVEIPCTIVALSYRGFWTSNGRASQPGIEKDAAAALDWTLNLRKELGTETKLVIWGQSIGAGVATTAIANALKTRWNGKVDGLILETPFVSIPKMLVALYPQKWIPYRYLWPFLRNWWDSEAALRTMKDYGMNVKMLLLSASKDEVVPLEQAQQLLDLCTQLGFAVRHEVIQHALHTEAIARQQGRAAVGGFLQQLGQEPKI